MAPWKSPAPLWKRLKPIARVFRSRPTAAERRLWEELRKNRFHGHRFRRQQVIGRCVADLFCAELRLVIEIDGGSHRGRVEEDSARQRYLEELGFRIFRVSNDSVLTDTNRVLRDLERHISSLDPLPTSSSPG